ncbi:MAG: hypothetical protein J6D28_04445 [Bacilli bacterium]|nr:hypothetical protein [Bacilli bacterium]
MKDKILKEIANFCEECESHECCPEKDCVLYRIEQLVVNDEENASNTSKKEEE